MARHIYLYCERNNNTGHVNEVAYSSRIKALREYGKMRDTLPGKPVNWTSQEDKKDVQHLGIRGMIDHLETHCFIGPRNGNQHYQSCYVVRKLVL